MLEQLPIKNTAGKTVQNIVSGWQCLALIFADGTFSFIEIEQDEDERHAPQFVDVEVDYIGDIVNRLRGDVAVECGILTSEEYTEYRHELDVQHAEANEERDRREYERLKKKYENKCREALEQP